MIDSMTPQELIKAAEKLMEHEKFNRWWEETYKKVIPAEEERLYMEMAMDAWDVSRIIKSGVDVEDWINQLRERGAI